MMRTRGRKQADEAAAAASSFDGGGSGSGSGSDNNARAASKTSSSPLAPGPPSTVVKIAKVEPPVRVPSKDLAKRDPASSSSSSSSTRLPRFLQFPLVVILSQTLATLGYSLAYPYIMSAMAAHERPLESWSEAALVVGWRM